MNGETVKYSYYEDNKKSFITIPVSLARAIGWNHGDQIGIKIETKPNGTQGFFIWKREN